METAAAAEQLPMEEKLKRQVEYYFSRESLSRDQFLRSQMNERREVPIALVASFKGVQALTKEVDVVVKVMRSSDQLVVDEAGAHVRPRVDYTKRTTLIIRDINATEEEIRELLSGVPNVKQVVSLKQDLQMWFCKFEEEDDAMSAVMHLQTLKFKDQPIRCRIKAQHITQAKVVNFNPYAPVFSGMVHKYPPNGRQQYRRHPQDQQDNNKENRYRSGRSRAGGSGRKKGQRNGGNNNNSNNHAAEKNSRAAPVDRKPANKTPQLNAEEFPALSNTYRYTVQDIRSVVKELKEPERPRSLDLKILQSHSPVLVAVMASPLKAPINTTALAEGALGFSPALPAMKAHTNIDAVPLNLGAPADNDTPSFAQLAAKPSKVVSQPVIKATRAPKPKASQSSSPQSQQQQQQGGHSRKTDKKAGRGDNKASEESPAPVAEESTDNGGDVVADSKKSPSVTSTPTAAPSSGGKSWADLAAAPAVAVAQSEAGSSASTPVATDAESQEEEGTASSS